MKKDCIHEISWIGRTGVMACGACGAVEWFAQGRPMDSAEGMASLFGAFEFIGALSTLHGPAGETLAYRPPSLRTRRRLESFPAKRWLLASPDLWMSHDGQTLLLCPTNPVLALALKSTGNQGAATR